MAKEEAKRKPGRPLKDVSIADTFENVVKATVTPLLPPQTVRDETAEDLPEGLSRPGLCS